jgi:hypothetical protein
MKHSGSADLPLHYGQVPKWLSERMARLGLAISESVLMEYGRKELVRRLSDPFWFQSLGAVMGMDWHSSGITTSVMAALKKALSPHAGEFGIYICGGKGKYSRQTPGELMIVADKTGLDGHYLARCSKLSAKIDNTAVQDGFQLYLHNFIVSADGDWSVVQQGMNNQTSMARRYHWHSENISSFVEEPHTFIYGQNQGDILNMVHRDASASREAILEISKNDPSRMIPEIRRLLMPKRHDLRTEDVDMKRLGAMLWVTHEKQSVDFESLMMLEGLGPRTLQSLALVSEVIYGTPSRFSDPARFSFAHGGKDGHPFPVPLFTYDETLRVMRQAIDKARLGNQDKQEAIKNLSKASVAAEKNFIPGDSIEPLLERERRDAWKYGGQTVFGKSQPPASQQLELF